MQTALIGEVSYIYLCSTYFWVILERSQYTISSYNTLLSVNS